MHDQWLAGLISVADYEHSMRHVRDELKILLSDAELRNFDNFREDKRKVDAARRLQDIIESNLAKLSGLTEENRQRFIEEYDKLNPEYLNVYTVRLEVDKLKAARTLLEDEFESDQLYVIDTLIQDMAENSYNQQPISN